MFSNNRDKLCYANYVVLLLVEVMLLAATVKAINSLIQQR